MFPMFIPEKKPISFWQSVKNCFKRRGRKAQAWQPDFDLMLNYLCKGTVSTEPWDGTFVPMNFDRRYKNVTETNRRVLKAFSE